MRIPATDILTGRRILLGVTGGIAAYKSAELVRLLRGAGAAVRVVMTPAACEFISPLTLQALSGQPVREALFDPQHEAAMGHIELARWAELILIAPASADFLARLRAGLANDLLSTLCLASSAPLYLAPAMNQQMWRAAATGENVAALQQRGVKLLGPASGEQACGEQGPGRMLEVSELLAACSEHFATDANPGPLQDIRLTITAGPTREAIDPVRFISNHSSGRMGFALAEAARQLGAEVTLVAGPVSLPTPAGVSRVDVQTAEQMLTAVLAAPADIFIGCAAVADYRPELVAESKIKKQAEALTLKLVRNPDILAQVAQTSPRPFCVGFAAETDSLAENARAKLAAKGVEMIAANWVGARAAGGGFDSAQNALQVFWADGEQTLAMAPKPQLARQLLDLILSHYPGRRP
ncbi:MAG: bifunctional phosphopantothenoylcysteine decarboxylase/phosphopantothenate--cysteine ligase CoaBC [Thiohalomonadaceae bacterium]